MLHEDRILRSIDLLTSNARETLIKYVEWAKTSNSDVTFNLFDALPTYTKDGGTGSGAYIKPITVPSFASISSGIFGEVATQSERDINWNFNFIANGKGWNFEEYVQTTGTTAKSSIIPKLSINVDTKFGKTKTGRLTNISFDSNNITYSSSNSSIAINDSGITLDVPLFNEYAKKAILNGTDIMIGSNSLLVSGITNPRGFNEKDSTSVTIVSKTLNISAFEGLILDYSVGTDSLKIGNTKFNRINLSKNVDDYFTESYSLHTLSDKNTIYLVDYNNNASKITLAEGVVYNVSIASLSNRLTTNTTEAIQFFVSPSDVAKVWVEGGLDKYYSNRKTATYSDILSNKIDSEKKSNSASSPYYLNIGTVGVTTITGTDELILSSNSEINVSVGTSSEIKISKGEVSIPNLVLPQMARIALSTLSKRTQVDNYGPTIVFPSKSSTLSDTKGIEVSTLTAYDGIIDLDKSTYIWSSFNSDATYTYHYIYSLLENNGSNDLVCKTYRTVSGYSKVNFNSPIYTTTIAKGISSLITKDQIFAVSGLNDTYILVLSNDTTFLGTNVGGGIEIYKSSNRASSFKRVSTIVVGGTDSFSIVNKLSASTYSSNVVNCGIQDKLAILLQKNYDNYTGTSFYNNNEYLVYVFDSNTETIYPDCFAKSYKENPSWGASKSTYNELTSKLASISILGDYVYLMRSKIVNGKYVGTITKISYLSDVADKVLQLTSAVFNFTSNETIATNMFLINSLTVSNVTINGTDSLVASTVFTQYSRSGVIDTSVNRINMGVDFEINLDFTTINVAHTTNGSNTSYSVYLLTPSNYYISESVGYDSTNPLRKVVNSIFFQKTNTSSTTKYIEVVSSNYGTSQYVNYNITNSLINYNTAYVLPINIANFALYLYNKIIFAYTASYGAAIDYSDLTTSTSVTSNAINYKNPYANSFKNNYVDNLGAVLSPNSSINYILSNRVSKEISYIIKNYGLDNNNIYESILERKIGNDIVDVISTSDTNSTSELFSKFIYEGGQYDIAPLTNYVKFATTKDSKEVSYSNIKNISVPVSITACGKESVSFDRKSGLLINNNSNVNLGNDISFNKIAVPVEALSIFTKRAYSNNTVTINRDDFSITFNPTAISSVTGITFGLLTYNYDTSSNSFKQNSGHSEEVLSEKDLSKYVFSGTVKQANITNAVVLMYDSVNNRTYAWVPEKSSPLSNDILFDIGDNTLWNTKAGILYNIDAKLLNPYDDNFNSYLSIVNEKANVVSIRVDYINTLSFQAINAENSALICGFSEINNQEEGC